MVGHRKEWSLCLEKARILFGPGSIRLVAVQAPFKVLTLPFQSIWLFQQKWQAIQPEVSEGLKSATGQETDPMKNHQKHCA
jgi:hypothetical protein